MAGVVAWYQAEPILRTTSNLIPGDVLFYVRTDVRAVALTFDDGPHPDITPRLLDVLARHGARATFFLIGDRLAGSEALLARMAAEGHELANHLMHDEPSVLLPDQEFQRQLSQVNSLLAPYGASRWFRPGSGWLTPRMLRSAARHDLRCVLGTVAGRHDGRRRDQQIAARLLRRIRPGTIAVLHEGTIARHGVVAATDQILHELSRRGMSAITVSELAALRSG
jgi:peptidoglycan/xylan/chitin deacetylase (PgdA/CDA1 family)